MEQFHIPAHSYGLLRIELSWFHQILEGCQHSHASLVFSSNDIVFQDLLEMGNSISYFWVPHVIFSQHPDNLEEVLDETLLFFVINIQFLVSIHSEGGVKYSVAGCGFFL